MEGVAVTSAKSIMIISASRRTDIPTWYSNWFFNRIKEGYVYVRNPMNPHQISKIDLSPDVIDGIVFWTKNPAPMLNRLDELKDYMYYFQFTLNSYGRDVECSVSSKNNVIIPAFQKLSDRIGPDRVIWRYDPIFLSRIYTMNYHIKYFEKLAKRLSPYTRQCTISFIDLYRDTARNMASLGTNEFSEERQEHLAKVLAEIAHSYGLQIATCAEKIDLERYGIEHAHCIDGQLFGKLLRCQLNVPKAKHQRQDCGCMESIDIGVYNTCCNGCKYCYANYMEQLTLNNREKHNPNSPLLIGDVMPEDKITERKTFSYRIE